MLAHTEELEMNKPVRIEGTKDYSYKGCILGKYESAKGGVRWMVEKDGREVIVDYRSLMAVKDYVDQHKGVQS